MRTPGFRHHHTPSTHSTQDLARRLLEDAPATALLVTAETQSAARGSHGRPWAAPPGGGWATLALPGRPVPEGPDATPLAVGLALAEAIERETGLRSRIKWPNDLRARGRKLAGVLCERPITAGVRTAPLLVGIGLNINLSPGDLPAELSEVATSLRIETGRDHPVTPLVQHIAEAVLHQLGAMDGARLSPQQHNALAGRLDLVGTRVRVGGTDGVVEGVDPQGLLLLRRSDQVLRIASGSIEIGHAGA